MAHFTRLERLRISFAGLSGACYMGSGMRFVWSLAGILVQNAVCDGLQVCPLDDGRLLGVSMMTFFVGILLSS